MSINPHPTPLNLNPATWTPTPTPPTPTLTLQPLHPSSRPSPLQALELLQKDPSNPMAAAFRRRERVWHRLMRRLETEHLQAEAARRDDALDRRQAHADHALHPLPKPHALVGEGRMDVAGRGDYASAQARVPAGPREAAALAGIAEEEREAADAAKPPPRKQRVHEFKGAVFYQPPGPDAPPAHPPPDYQFRDGFFYRAVGMAPVPAQGQGAGGGKGGGGNRPQGQRVAPHAGVGVDAGGLSGPAPQPTPVASHTAEAKARKRERGERLRLRLPPDQLGEAAGGAQRGRQASPQGAREGAARVRWAQQGPGVVGGGDGGGGGGGGRGTGDGGGGRGDAISGGGGGGGRGGAMGGAGGGGEGGCGWGLTYEGSPGMPTHQQEVEGARRRVVAAAIASAGWARQRRRMAPA